MPKSTKSSASSATRKKQAAKAAKKSGKDGAPSASAAANGGQALQRGQKKEKGKKKEPKKKVYIPPSKPKSDDVDPLDALGLASLLPPDLVLLLRKAGKKDMTTRIRALEGLLEWIKGDEAAADDADERRAALITALPSWTHLFPRLVVSPNRRLRQLMVQVSAKVWESQDVLSELVAQPHLIEAVLGPLLVVAHGPDRLVSRMASSLLTNCTTWDEQQQNDRIYLTAYMDTIIEHLSSILFHSNDPAKSNHSVTPVNTDASDQRAATLDPLSVARNAKNRDDGNVEEDTEGTEGRLVCGALGSLAWVVQAHPPVESSENLLDLLSHPTVWTALNPIAPSDSTATRSLGSLSPAVRIASWTLLRSLVVEWPEALDVCLSVLGPRALSSFFEETDVMVAQTMSESLVRLLRLRPQTWKIGGDEDDDDGDEDEEDVAHKNDDEEEDDDDGAGVDEGENDNHNGETTEHNGHASSTSEHLTGLLDYLRRGLCGIASSYGVVILLLATLPDDILPPTSQAAREVLQAIYTPMEEEALEGLEIQRAFVTSFLENLTWLTGRVAAKTSTEEAIKVADGIQMLWNDYIDADSEDEDASLVEQRSNTRTRRTNSLGERRLVTELGNCLRKLGTIDTSLTAPVLRLVRRVFAKSLSIPSMPADLVCQVLVIATQPSANNVPASSALVSTIHGLVNDVTYTTANIVASGEALSQGLYALQLLLLHFPSAVHSDEAALRAVDLAFKRLLNDRSNDLSKVQLASFSIALLHLLRDEDVQRQRWIELLDSSVLPNDTESHSAPLDWSLLRALLKEATQKSSAPPFQSYSEKLESSLSQHYSDNLSVTSHLVARAGYVISPASANAILAQTVRSASATSELVVLEEWLQVDNGRVQLALDSFLSTSSISRIFDAAKFRSDRHANNVWKLISSDARVAQVVQLELQARVIDPAYPLESLVDLSKSLQLNIENLVPPQETMQHQFQESCILLSRFTPVTLNLQDELVNLTNEADLQSSQSDIQEQQYDGEGLTVAARAFLARLISVEGGSSQKSANDLPLLVILATAAEDALLERKAGRSLFSQVVPRSRLEDYLRRSISLSTSILSSKSSNLGLGWFESLCKVLQEQSGPAQEDDMLQMFAQLWATTGASRIFARLLRGCLNFSGVGEAEHVLLLRAAQVVEKTQADNARAIYVATKESVLETPLYQRICNQNAADLAGVKSNAAKDKGLALLRTLVALAPPTDASISLVPQQRCVFLMRSLQSWIVSEDELPSEIFVRLAQLFLHVLPVVQDVPGNHLDLIIDVIELNLGDLDLSKDTDLVALYHTLVLLETLIGLAERSATLREVWKDRHAAVFDALRQIVISYSRTATLDVSGGREKNQAVDRSNIRLQIEEVLIDILRFVPRKLFKDDFAHLMHLLQLSSSSSLPTLAYRILSQNIREQVKDLVVEAAMNSAEAKNKIENLDKEDEDDESAEAKDQAATITRKVYKMPEELVALLDAPAEIGDMAYLLAWLVAFEFFEESSLELRAAYTTQLQSLQLVEAKLIPLLLSTLDQTNDPSAKYVLDEIFLDDIFSVDGNTQASIDVLTIHVFYRALIHTPNLVCDAFFSMKDRQQSMALRNLTVRHLTPLLSQREFGHLRQADVLDRLQDENMQIRVLANASEVVATYTVDEYPLEIAISMPTDYPLHPIEVRDLRKIGISEGTWRAWILGMRQLIAGRNGLIFDALLLFKRNVEAKFSGYDEDSTCAICYSIVSPTDHSLPTKPCKTCKKKFHASCLYKWVSTSGSSTCPLCRSIL